MDDIAIQCKTEAEWEKVKSEIGTSNPTWRDDVFGEPADCISGRGSGWASRSYYEKGGYKIISAAEYLNEGGKDVSEFKLGDRVECIQFVNMLSKGDQGTICAIVEGASCSIGVEWDNAISGHDCQGAAKYGYGYWMTPKQVKLITKTQTTKENNMNINSSIRTVLVEENKETFETVEKFQKVFGAEIAENFTGAMILRKNIKAYNDEIKRLDDIEAKRLEKEEKDK